MQNLQYYEIYHEKNKAAKKIEMEQERDKAKAEADKAKAEKEEKEGKKDEKKDEKEEKEEEVKEITVKDVAQKLLDKWNKMKTEEKVEFLGEDLKLPQKNNLFKRSYGFVYSFGFKIVMTLSIITSFIGWLDMKRGTFTIDSVAVFQKI